MDLLRSSQDLKGPQVPPAAAELRVKAPVAPEAAPKAWPAPPPLGFFQILKLELRVPGPEPRSPSSRFPGRCGEVCDTAIQLVRTSPGAVTSTLLPAPLRPARPGPPAWSPQAGAQWATAS
ncbi:uncharacterized protein LOC144217097 isoform X2 [Crocuta crocuta]